MYEYGSDFYCFLSSFAVRSASVIVPLVGAACPIAGAADFGCGHGAWLSVWKASGAEIVGVDGPYVDRSRLLIPDEAFRPADLATPVDLGRRFDLVQSLETAEHLPRAAAKGFVRTLARHADLILFSAAVPGQGGEHHVNEQPLEYWRDLFASESYQPVDFIRPAARENPDVQLWYRCNTILYANAEGLTRLSAAARKFLVPSDRPLEDYWPLSSRLQQRVLRLLPNPMVDRLSRLNASIAARGENRRRLAAAG